MNEEKKNSFDPADFPQKEAFTRKEVYQHPQPADQGKPLNHDEKDDSHPLSGSKEQDRTSKEEGLNESRSPGNAGAFEGFEDQQKD